MKRIHSNAIESFNFTHQLSIFRAFLRRELMTMTEYISAAVKGKIMQIVIKAPNWVNI